MLPKKIISLLPSATEIVCALGYESQLVGRSHECDFPESVKDLPVCSKAKLTNALSSKEIDTNVKRILTEALSLYEIDIEKIRSLAPDIIITQDQCKVCAVNLDDVRNSLQDIIGKEIELISLHPDSLEDILNDIILIAEKIGMKERGIELAEELTERYELVQHKVKFVKNRQKVLCIEWLEPLMAAGNWTPELIEIAGGDFVLSEKHKHSPWLKWEQIVAEDPDMIIIAPCGFTIERTLQETHLLTEQKEWNELKAVKNNKVFIADGNYYFNRSGPRIIDTIEILAEIIQANQFYYGMENVAWRQL
jgi:iron complex transport system substrate-binding protein